MYMPDICSPRYYNKILIASTHLKICAILLNLLLNPHMAGVDAYGIEVTNPVFVVRFEPDFGRGGMFLSFSQSRRFFAILKGIHDDVPEKLILKVPHPINRFYYWTFENDSVELQRNSIFFDSHGQCATCSFTREVQRSLMRLIEELRTGFFPDSDVSRGRVVILQENNRTCHLLLSNAVYQIERMMNDYNEYMQCDVNKDIVVNTRSYTLHSWIYNLSKNEMQKYISFDINYAFPVNNCISYVEKVDRLQMQLRGQTP